MTPPERAGTRASPTAPAALGAAAALLAIALPMLLAYNVAPSATFYNQAAAVVGWSVLSMTLLAIAGQDARRLGSTAGHPMSARDGVASILAALGLLALAALASPFATGLPAALAWSSATILLAAGWVFLCGVALARSGAATAAFRALCIALAVAGVASVALGIVQVYFPQAAGNGWLAAIGEGRAAGNLRQANHLGTLLLWAIVALVWLGEAGVVRGRVMVSLAGLHLFGLVLTASRTATIGVVMLALWALLDRRLSSASRRLLLLAPLLYAALWWALSAWAAHGEVAFAGAGRFSTEGDISTSRFGIWSNTLALIARHPWLGVGWGEFNLAWTLTPFPGRPVLFFDHTHNLLLQLAVELGVPLALLVLALLLHALWQAFAASRKASDGKGALRPAAFMMVLLVGIHSLLEYPLWYAYFLFPTVFAWGLCLGETRLTQPSRAGLADSTRGKVIGRHALFAGAVLMGVGGLLAIVDYQRVSSIFTDEARTPLEQRIAAGQRSLLFSHHAAYAAATNAESPSTAMASFDIAKHYLLDTRLMMAWAQAFAERGDLERARHIAARLREFGNPDSAEFFAVCDAPASRPVATRSLPHGAAPALEKPSTGPVPFQCTPPAQAMDYRAFR